jgi:hypothetical protein
VSTVGEPEPATAERAFGSENRARLLAEFLDGESAVTTANAWKLVYRLLLWIDQTTGLAHCYESDKCQPGRPWYARSLAFHDWLSTQFDVTPGELGGSIDWLFRKAVRDLAATANADRVTLGAAQREAYVVRDMPLPGENPELIAVIRETLGGSLALEPGVDIWKQLTERIHLHVTQENKRKNLLGEGFEDTLAALIRGLPNAAGTEVRNRVLLEEIPGFNPQGDTEKRKRVDLAIWKPDESKRLLVTAKWSVRADREEQFGTDFDAYVRVNAGRPFEHVLITNEFDAARLKAACERLAGNAFLFTTVVHVNPEGVLHTYGTKLRGAAKSLAGFTRSGRLISLEQWLTNTFA